MEDIENFPISDDSTTASNAKKSKHVWIENEDVLILRQFRFMDVERIPMNKRGIIWHEISVAMEKANSVISNRSVRDRFKLLREAFRKSNPKDEWKTGNPNGYSEKDKLLLEICQAEEEAERRRMELDGLKGKKEEKRDRMEEKLMIAAQHAQKKRQKENGSDDDGLGPPSKTRHTFQSTASDFFRAKTAEASQKLALAERLLALQEERLALDKAKHELEKTREERLLSESVTLKAQNAALMERLTKLGNK